MASLNIRENHASEETLQRRNALLDRMEETTKSQIQWHQCGAPAYRQMRREGTNGFPVPQYNESATTVTFKARDGYLVELNVIQPSSGRSDGVFLHFHAGGFVMGSSRSYDPYLTKLADRLSVTVVSVEYRLAPENLYPIGQDDCVDAALFSLSEEGKRRLGGPVKILGGESAGGYLAVRVALVLRDEHKIDLRQRQISLIATAGIFDVTLTPSVVNHTREVILGKEGTEKFVEAAFSKVTLTERKQGMVSPLYADVKSMPRALFLVGAVDPLLDDSVFMAARWSQAGNETTLRIVPAACHAFTLFGLGEVSDEGIQEIVQFVDQQAVQ